MSKQTKSISAAGKDRFARKLGVSEAYAYDIIDHADNVRAALAEEPEIALDDAVFAQAQDFCRVFGFDAASAEAQQTQREIAAAYREFFS